MKFGKRESVLQVEEGECFAPKFDENSLIPCVTQHAATKEILMFAYMNAEALDATLSTGLAHYWSRSRQKLWRKGETSGMTQRVHPYTDGSKVATTLVCIEKGMACRHRQTPDLPTS